MERKCWENEQYSRKESIEISGIPQSIEQIDLEKIGAPVDPYHIEVSHRLISNDNG